MKSDFLIKRNKRGKKSEGAFINGKGEKRKGIIHFLILSFGELSR